jgi:hypothetical protein
MTIGGVPATGAKSRVETQLKITIRLSETSGDVSTRYSHLKLPESMLVKDRIRKHARGTNLHRKGDGWCDFRTEKTLIFSMVRS